MVTMIRIKHAAHYAGTSDGHDLEQWDVSGIDWRPGQRNPSGIGANAEYAYGYIDKIGGQHWMFTRVAPLSPGRCAHCSRPEPTPDETAAKGAEK